MRETVTQVLWFLKRLVILLTDRGQVRSLIFWISTPIEIELYLMEQKDLSFIDSKIPRYVFNASTVNGWLFNEVSGIFSWTTSLTFFIDTQQWWIAEETWCHSNARETTSYEWCEKLTKRICNYPTPPLRAGCGTRSFLRGVELVWIEFFFFWTSWFTKAKEPSLPYYLLKLDQDSSYQFQFHGDTHYTTSASKHVRTNITITFVCQFRALLKLKNDIEFLKRFIINC